MLTKQELLEQIRTKLESKDKELLEYVYSRLVQDFVRDRIRISCPSKFSKVNRERVKSKLEVLGWRVEIVDNSCFNEIDHTFVIYED